MNSQNCFRFIFKEVFNFSLLKTPRNKHIHMMFTYVKHICRYIEVCTSTRIHTKMYMSLESHTHKHMYICKGIARATHKDIYTQEHVYIQEHTSTHVHMQIHIHIRICKHRECVSM